MKKRKHVFWETLLLLGSVLVFRGLWHIMDKIPIMNGVYFLMLSFLTGLVMMCIGFYRMAHTH